MAKIWHFSNRNILPASLSQSCKCHLVALWAAEEGSRSKFLSLAEFCWDGYISTQFVDFNEQELESTSVSQLPFFILPQSLGLIQVLDQYKLFSFLQMLAFHPFQVIQISYKLEPKIILNLFHSY